MHICNDNWKKCYGTYIRDSADNTKQSARGQRSYVSDLDCGAGRKDNSVRTLSCIVSDCQVVVAGDMNTSRRADAHGPIVHGEIGHRNVVALDEAIEVHGINGGLQGGGSLCETYSFVLNCLVVCVI